MGDPQSSTASGPRIQKSPDGWEVYHCFIDRKRHDGYLQYKTICPCGRTTPRNGCTGCPHELREWAEAHASQSCRPEYKTLLPLPNEQYPDHLNNNQRKCHKGYLKYKKRVQKTLGFYSTVLMLEEAGFCLPEHAQKVWDEKRQAAVRLRHREPSAQPGELEEIEGSVANESQDNNSEGCCLPEEQQEVSDSHHKGKGKAMQPRRKKKAPKGTEAPIQSRPRRKRGRRESLAEASSDTEQSWEVEEASDGSEFKAPQGCQGDAKRRKKASPANVQAAASARIDGSYESPDTPVQADKGKRRRQPSPTPHIAVKGEEAGPSAPEQDAPASPSESPRAAAQSNPAAAPLKVEIVDLTADSPRASSCAQLPGLLESLQMAHAASHQATPGHKAAATGITQMDSSNAETVHVLPATTRIAGTSCAPNGPPTPRNGACTLGDVIADVTRLKAVEAKIAAAGVQLDFDQILQCLRSASIQEALADQQEARIAERQIRADTLQREHAAALAEMQSRVEKIEKLLTYKDAEVNSLRNQLKLMQA